MVAMRWTRNGLRLAGPVVLATAWGGAVVAAQATLAGQPLPSGGPHVLVAPDDATLAYSEYVHATISATRARFERPSVSGFGTLHSPGTRIGFTTDATRIRMRVDYLQTSPVPGAGRFRLEMDGRLLARRFGSDADLGAGWYTLIDAPSASPSPRRTPSATHEYSLILPYASDVDFLGLELDGGALASPAPARPPFLYVPYGDSITQGYTASSVANGYPYLVGRLLDWSVIDMGFSGRTVTASDGTAVGVLGGDCVSVAIGVNDYLGGTTAKVFRERYNGFLSALRDQQPSVPVFVLTPTWVSTEGETNAAGLTVEDYRQEIREIVAARAPTDPNLHLVEGLALVPAGLAYFPDGIHPNDAGFVFYAAGLEAVFTSTLAGAGGEVAASGGRDPARGRPATMRFVGRGRAGTHGVPELVADAAPVRGTTFTIELENPLGRPTAAALLLAPARFVSKRRRVLPLDLAGARFATIPAGGARFSLSIPEARCGDVLLQAVQVDPGAAGGLAATRLLSLSPGD